MNTWNIKKIKNKYFSKDIAKKSSPMHEITYNMNAGIFRPMLHNGRIKYGVLFRAHGFHKTNTVHLLNLKTLMIHYNVTDMVLTVLYLDLF